MTALNAKQKLVSRFESFYPLWLVDRVFGGRHLTKSAETAKACGEVFSKCRFEGAAMPCALVCLYNLFKFPVRLVGSYDMEFDQSARVHGVCRHHCVVSHSKI